MKKDFIKLLSVLLILLAFFNCQEPVSEKGKGDKGDNDKSNYVESSLTLMNNLKGYWENNTYDAFEITGDTLPQTFYQYDDHSKTISFAGNIVGNEDDSKANGFITIQITESGTWGKTIGYYLVIRWKDLTVNTVNESAASKYPEDYALGKSTKKEAELTYTIANGYFAYYGDYEKQ